MSVKVEDIVAARRGKDDGRMLFDRPEPVAKAPWAVAPIESLTAAEISDLLGRRQMQGRNEGWHDGYRAALEEREEYARVEATRWVEVAIELVQREVADVSDAAGEAAKQAAMARNTRAQKAGPERAEKAAEAAAESNTKATLLVLSLEKLLADLRDRGTLEG